VLNYLKVQVYSVPAATGQWELQDTKVKTLSQGIKSLKQYNCLFYKLISIYLRAEKLIRQMICDGFQTKYSFFRQYISKRG
jgi:hypothetical protein